MPRRDPTLARFLQLESQLMVAETYITQTLRSVRRLIRDHQLDQVQTRALPAAATPENNSTPATASDGATSERSHRRAKSRQGYGLSPIGAFLIRAALKRGRIPLTLEDLLGKAYANWEEQNITTRPGGSKVSLRDDIASPDGVIRKHLRQVLSVLRRVKDNPSAPEVQRTAAMQLYVEVKRRDWEKLIDAAAGWGIPGAEDLR